MSRPSMFPMKLREDVRSSSNASRVRSLPLPSSSPTQSSPTRAAALSPTSTEASPNSRAAATAPSTTTAGPKSPPMASTAIFIGRGSLASKLLALDRDDFSALVVAALQADLVGHLHFPALRTDGPRGHSHLVMGAALAPAGLGMSSLRQRHGVMA